MRRRKLIFVTGVPGSGKSHYISESKLASLPVVDIQWVYRYYPETHGLGGWQIAQDKMLERAMQIRDEYDTDVVVEAVLFKGTPSRTRLEYLLMEQKIRHKFINIETDYSTCIARVEADFQQAQEIFKNCPHALEYQTKYYQKRKDILTNYHARGYL